MSSAIHVYSFPVPLGRRGTTALAVIALHVVFALGLIASMVITSPPKPPPTWEPPIVVPRPIEPVHRIGPADPSGPTLPPLRPFTPPPDEVIVQPTVFVPDVPPITTGEPPADRTVSNVRVLRGEQPPYPAAARRLGEEGVVVVRVRVGATGRAELVEVASSSGHPRLDQTAVAAVRQWIFAPAQTASGAIVSWVTLSVRFRLTD